MNRPADVWKYVQFGSADDCWPWTASRSTNGYGQFRLAGTMVRAHRLAWELARGPAPEGLVLDHLCRNRACCNPNHLEVVTVRENTLRGIGPSAVNATATHCRHGHPLDENHSVIDGRGKRRCLTCARRRSRISERARRARIKNSAGHELGGRTAESIPAQPTATSTT